MKKVLLIFAIFLLLCPGVKGVKADDLKLAEKAKSAILIEASTQNGGMLSLQATDNEIEISDKVQAQVENEGNLTVSAHKLYDIVKKLPKITPLKKVILRTGTIC